MAKKDRNDQVPTPVKYVEEMLDRIAYKDNLAGKKVLENSCGEGHILLSIVKRYLTDAKRLGLSVQETVRGLEEDIIAFETDIKLIEICRNRLNDACAAAGIYGVNWNILNQNFLEYEVDQIHAMYVIGNPPYVTYHDIEKKERDFLQEHFAVCKKGRFDYCYAFIEASIRALSTGGKFIYLIPFSIFRNRYAENLRKFIWNDTVRVVDFSGRKVFQGITCSSAFLICEKGNHLGQVFYEGVETGESRVIDKSLLGPNGEKWIFYNTTKGPKKFGDYFNVYNSVATLLNEAFLICPVGEEDDCFCLEKGTVEKAVCLPAASTKSKKKEDKQKEQKELKKQYIIFPYRRNPDGISRYSETDFKSLYPDAYRYLEQFKSKLQKRKADKNIDWFEYGRGQLLNELWEEKLIMPMVVTKQAKVYWADADTVPYAGYFVTRKSGSEYTMADAEKILKSMAFYQYVKEVGTPTTETSYRVSVNDIKEYRFE